MKKISIFLVFCLIVLLSTACTIEIGNQTSGSGTVITEKRNVDNFTKIENTTSADLNIVQGSPQEVSVEGEDNILPLIVTKVSGGTLKISTKPGSSIRTTRPLTVYVTVPELSSIRVTGSGDVEMDAWEAGAVEIEDTGSGDIRIGDLQADRLQVKMTGSCDVSLGGKVDDQTIRITGSGDIDAKSLQSRTADVTLTGSGNATLWVTDDLSASLSGSGDLSYYGNPDLDKRETGSGSVEQLGDQP